MHIKKSKFQKRIHKNNEKEHKLQSTTYPCAKCLFFANISPTFNCGASLPCMLPLSPESPTNGNAETQWRNIIRRIYSPAPVACCDVRNITANIESSIRSRFTSHSVRDCLQLELVLFSQAGSIAAVLTTISLPSR